MADTDEDRASRLSQQISDLHKQALDNLDELIKAKVLIREIGNTIGSGASPTAKVFIIQRLMEQAILDRG